MVNDKWLMVNSNGRDKSTPLRDNGITVGASIYGAHNNNINHLSLTTNH